MYSKSKLLAVATTTLTLFAVSAPAHAQATRTWVSGVGDDVNPCSRTAPCKTYAGAISKTAPNGIIDCLDPGGFGAVTITKSITIDCRVSPGGPLASGGINAIIINAPAGSTIVLRGMDIEGSGGAGANGLNGVNIISGGSNTVRIEDCNIFSFSTAGINFAPSPGGGGTLVVNHTQIHGNGTGIILNGANGAVNMLVRDSIVDTSASHGISVTTGATHAGATIQNSTVAFNAGTGVNVSGAGGIAIIGDNTISGNGVGVAGAVQSFKNNQIFGNSSDGTPITAVPAPGQPLQ